MPYMPPTRRSLPTRHIPPPRRYVAYTLEPQLGSLLGDVFSGVKTALVQSVNTSVTALKSTLVTTAQQEAAAAASKAAIRVLQGKKKPAVAPKTALPGAAPAAPAVPGTPEAAAPAAVPGQSTQVVFMPQEGMDIKKYLPYAGVAAGVVVLVLVLRSRK